VSCTAVISQLTAAKFLCVKGILFFSFWQGVFVGFLVSTGAIKSGALHELTVS
jgi:hypothetical protein